MVCKVYEACSRVGQKNPHRQHDQGSKSVNLETKLHLETLIEKNNFLNVGKI